MREFARVAAVVCVLSGVGLGQAGFSAAKRPMTFADLQAMKRVSDPQISPGGRWVMFSVTDVSLDKNTKTNHLWVVPMAVGKEEQLTSGGGESEGRFSPDGKWVAYVAAADSAGSQIWLAAWDEARGEPDKARRLTNISTEVDGPVWSPDSQRLLFVSRVYPDCSDRTDEDACDKTKDDAVAASPVKAMVFDHLLYRHWTEYIGEKRSHVLVVSASDGAQVRDLTPKSAIGEAEAPVFSLGGPIGYAWAQDSKEVAYVTNLDAVPAASTNNDVFTLRLDELGARAVKISTSPGSDDAPAYSPDGKWLAFRSQARAGFESDRFRLMVYDRTAKTIKELMPRFDGWVDEFTWAPNSQGIYFAASDKGSESIFFHSDRDMSHSDRDMQPISQSRPEYALNESAPDGEYSDIRITSRGDKLVAGKMKVNSPTEIVRFDLDRHFPPSDFILSPFYLSVKERERITHINDKLVQSLELSDMEPFWFNATDGVKVEGFVVRPPNFDASKKYPLKFLMHGGPQTAWGDAWSYRWNPELFAANGYVVVMINRRGSTGYGQKFIDQVSGDWGGKAYTDLMRGLDYAEVHYPFIDRTRECALGASYGGFMANWVLTHTRRFQCIVTHDGMYDPASAYGTTEELWFNEWEFRPLAANRMVEQAGPRNGRPGQPWDYFDKPALLDPFRKFSPMQFIRNAKTPTLIIHSQCDYRLDVSQGFEMFTALQRLGVPSKMLYFPDEGHWVLKPKNSQLWYETVNDWCDRWTHSGKYAGVIQQPEPVASGTKPTAKRSAASVKRSVDQ